MFIEKRNVRTFVYLITILLFLTLLFGKNVYFVYYSFFALFAAELSGDALIKFLRFKNFEIFGRNKSAAEEMILKAIILFIVLVVLVAVTRLSDKLGDNTSLFNGYVLTSLFILVLLSTCIYWLSGNYYRIITMPVAVSVFLYCFFNEPSTELLLNFAGGIILGVLIVYPSFRFKLLEESGAVAAFLLAVILFGLGGLKWSIPILFFFFPSSILSKFRDKIIKTDYLPFDKGSVRDKFQVLANGGIGLLLITLNLFYKSKILYLGYIASLSAVSADTWATEIGTLTKAKTFDIIKFIEVKRGASGGVSVFGTLGSVAGAAVIGVSAIYWIGSFAFLIVTFAGFLGCLLDSILGSLFQLQYRCRVCGEITERKIHCGQPAEYFKGFYLLNNDSVNFIASLFAAIIVIAFFSLYF